jgi:uncharacterized protein YjiS (DUF1127 family)
MQNAQSCSAAKVLLHCTMAHYLPYTNRRGIRPYRQRVNAMIFSHILRAYKQWRRYNESLSQLNRLGDRELADIGITRGDIPRVAWETSER